MNAHSVKVKNGHDYKGAQKYHCRTCGRYGTLKGQKGYAVERHGQVQRALLERVSLRGIGRIFQMSRRTVRRIIARCRCLYLKFALGISLPHLATRQFLGNVDA